MFKLYPQFLYTSMYNKAQLEKTSTEMVTKVKQVFSTIMLTKN